MKKSIIMAFTLGALSMLTLNVFASDNSGAQPNTQVTNKVEANKKETNKQEDTANRYLRGCGYDCTKEEPCGDRNDCVTDPECLESGCLDNGCGDGQNGNGCGTDYRMNSNGMSRRGRGC